MSLSLAAPLICTRYAGCSSKLITGRGWGMGALLLRVVICDTGDSDSDGRLALLVTFCFGIFSIIIGDSYLCNKGHQKKKALLELGCISGGEGDWRMNPGRCF
ncbi:hypothetical protein F4811DRAFT_539951 [Daldinia bambusicola]|nr:hypothetical protein F4811DRAFT_539951 [Daldinia bambusicola]